MGFGSIRRHPTTFLSDLEVYLNYKFRSGTVYIGTLDHAITAARTWTLPDATGTLMISTGGLLTAGSVVFVDSVGLLTEDNSNFFWNNTDNRLGLGVNSGLTAGLEVQHAGPAAIFQNTSDAVSNQVAVFRGGNRATAADADEAYISLSLDADDGMTEYARLTWIAKDVTTGTEDGQFKISVRTGDVLTDMFQIDSTAAGVVTTTIPAGDVVLQDNVSILFGTAGAESDLSSNGTNTIWTMSSGDLLINGATDGVLQVTQTQDAASVQAAIFQGDRATATDDDSAYISLQMSDDGGVQEEVVRLSWQQRDVNPTADGLFSISVAQAGTLRNMFRTQSTSGGVLQTDFNDDNQDVDHIFHADNNSNLFTLDGGEFSGVGSIHLLSYSAGQGRSVAIRGTALTSTGSTDHTVLAVNSLGITTAAGSTKTRITTVGFEEPNITLGGGGATVANAATVYIANQPTEGTTVNASIQLGATAANIQGLDTGSVVFNEDSLDVNFRIESAGNINAFSLDAGAETLKFGTQFTANLNDSTGYSAGAVAIGDSSSLTAYTVLRLATGDTQLASATAAKGIGQLVRVRRLTSEFTSAVRGIEDLVVITNTNSQNWSTTTFGGGLVGNFIDVSLESGNSSTFTLSQVTGSYILMEGGSNANATITNYRGIWIANPTSISGTFTTQYGIYIENLTSAATDIGLYIAGAGTYAIHVDDGLIRNDSSYVQGHTALLAAGETTALWQMHGSSSAPSMTAVIGGFSTSVTVAPSVSFVKGNSNTIGAVTLVDDNEVLGQVRAYASDGVDLDTSVASILFLVDDAAPGAGVIGGEILFQTSTTNAVGTGVQPRMRIGSAGTTDLLGVANTNTIFNITAPGTGDAVLTFTGAGLTTTWYVGVDNSNLDRLKIGVGSTVGTTTVIDLNGLTSGQTQISRFYVPGASITLSDSDSAHYKAGNFEAATVTLAGTTQVTGLWMFLDVGVLTIAQSGGAVTVDKATGIASVSPTAGASVTLTHSSAFRARAGGAAVNVSGMYFEAQTAGTTSNHAIFVETMAGYAVTVGNSDADQNLIHVGVSGDPVLSWDESDDEFESNKGIEFTAGKVRVGLAATAGGSASFASGILIGADSTDNLFDDASNGAGSTAMYIGNGQINVTSDLRLKENVVDTTRSATKLLNKLRVVDYTWNDPSDTNNPYGKHSRGVWTGMIAQEMVDVVPWIINAPDKNCTICRSGRACSVHTSSWFVEYEHLVPTLVKGFQEHENRLDDHELRLNNYAVELEALQEENSRLQAELETLRK